MFIVTDAHLLVPVLYVKEFSDGVLEVKKCTDADSVLHSTLSLVEGRIIETQIPGAKPAKLAKDMTSYYIPKSWVFKMPDYSPNAAVPDPDSTEDNVRIIFKGFKSACNTGRSNDSDDDDHDDGDSDTETDSHQLFSFAPEVPTAKATLKRTAKGRPKKDTVAQAAALGEVVPALESVPNLWISEHRVPVSFKPGDFVQVTNSTWLGSFLGLVVAIEPNPRFIRNHEDYVVVQVPYDMFNARRASTFTATTVFVLKRLAHKCLTKVRNVHVFLTLLTSPNDVSPRLGRNPE